MANNKRVNQKKKKNINFKHNYIDNIKKLQLKLEQYTRLTCKSSKIASGLKQFIAFKILLENWIIKNFKNPSHRFTFILRKIIHIGFNDK